MMRFQAEMSEIPFSRTNQKATSMQSVAGSIFATTAIVHPADG
jgi:hypothetical protein